MKTLKNYVSGQLIDPHSGTYLPDICPATGDIIANVPDSEASDINQAVEAAQNAFPQWSAMPGRQRANFLRRISNGILERLQQLADAESEDTGKPITAALQVDIPRSAQNFDFFADAITQFSSEFHATDLSVLNYTSRTPLGVVGCISPWNLPLYLLTWKLAPALAMGNTVVAKPSEVTPMSATLLSEICIEVGLPPGVLNIVHGKGTKVGPTLIQHPHVQAISFTGSTRTGLEISRLAAPSFKKVSLEMGGKNPTIVFADAHFENAIAGVLKSTFSNQGQICLCSSRIYIEKSIYAEFKAALLARTQQLRVGDPQDSSTDQGSITSEVHFDKIMSHIEQAKKEGGSILTGGHRKQLPGRCQKGWFIEPTLIEDLSIDCSTNQEEIFGPVATLTPFDSEEDVIQMANDSRYGLSASIWTNNLSRAHRLSSKIHAGMVWINCWMIRDLRTPFGGWKHSGVGREGGLDALRFFTESKNTCIQL